ncbi:MAG TPA: type II toxin-antitoxin system RelE/ParE family toxin [Verrucomicrobiales bacterium]|nr:type II toxin-antitoxin system RelE/ParE family toxin [Verrucomicrobiales bacterium]
MDFKLIWSESAISDLGGIVRHISVRSGPEAARRIGFGLYDRAQVLTRHPEAGSILPERQDPQWRKLIFKSWKIAYRIDSKSNLVHVIRVWHAAQGEIEV